MNTEINKKIEEAKREIEYWENLIKKIGMRWDYSFESEALTNKKGILKGLEEAKKSYDDEIPRRPYKNQKKKDIELCNAYQKGLIDGRKEQKENELKELTGNPTGLDQFIEWKQDDVKRVLIKKDDEMKKKIDDFQKVIDKECKKVKAIEINIREYDKFISAHNLQEGFDEIFGDAQLKEEESKYDN